MVELGGVATRATLLRLTSRAELDRAVLGGDVVRVARGKLALPQADEALRAAHALAGVLSHTSAAMQWGWELKTVPKRPHVTVPEKRKVSVHRRNGVHLHRCDLQRIAVSACGPGAPRIRRICAEASGDAANPFESVLRAIALDVRGLRVRPQVTIAASVQWWTVGSCSASPGRTSCTTPTTCVRFSRMS